LEVAEEGMTSESLPLLYLYGSYAADSDEVFFFCRAFGVLLTARNTGKYLKR
jgi:hypothetical protein